jgi:lysophospholipase L1-like esterase
MFLTIQDMMRMQYRASLNIPAPTPPAPTPPAVQLTQGLIGFGDSTMYGIAATAPANQSLNLYSAAIGLTPLQKAVSGTILQNGIDGSGAVRANNGTNRYVVDTMGSNIRSKIISNYGLNDLRYTAAPNTINLANFKAQYTTMVAAWKAAGMDVTLASPVWIPDAGYTTGSAGFTGSSRTIHEQYCEAIYQIAREQGVKYAATYEYMRDNGGASLVDADNIHPNNAGHAAMAASWQAATVPVNATWGGASAPPAPTPTPPAPTPPAPSPSAATPVTIQESTTNPVMSGNSTTEVYTSNPTGGIARVGTFVVGTDATFEIQHPNTTDSGAVLAFDVQSGLPTTTSTQDYIAQIIPSGAIYQAANSNSALVIPNYTLVAGTTARMRLHCDTAGLVTLETQNDDASSWVVRYTYPISATAGTTMHVRMYCTWSASQRRIYQPRTTGVTAA